MLLQRTSIYAWLRDIALGDAKLTKGVNPPALRRAATSLALSRFCSAAASSAATSSQRCCSTVSVLGAASRYLLCSSSSKYLTRSYCSHGGRLWKGHQRPTLSQVRGAVVCGHLQHPQQRRHNNQRSEPFHKQHDAAGSAPLQLAEADALSIPRLVEANLAEVLEHCRVNVIDGPPPVRTVYQVPVLRDVKTSGTVPGRHCAQSEDVS